MTVSYPDIGLVQYVKSKRAKRINITIKPFKGIVVSVPAFVSQNNAETIVLRNADWIRQKLETIKSRESNQSIDINTEWSSVFHVYRLRHSDDNSFSILKKNRSVEISVPSGIPFENPDARNYISKSLESMLRKEAKIYLPERIDLLSNSVQINFNKLRINKAKTRWGSCSSKNNINLSLYLMLLPIHLIDYVILHELAHVKVKNHSKDYWSYLNQICPGAKELDKELKVVARELLIA